LTAALPGLPPRGDAAGRSSLISRRAADVVAALKSDPDADAVLLDAGGLAGAA